MKHEQKTDKIDQQVNTSERTTDIMSVTSQPVGDNHKIGNELQVQTKYDEETNGHVNEVITSANKSPSYDDVAGQQIKSNNKHFRREKGWWTMMIYLYFPY